MGFGADSPKTPSVLFFFMPGGSDGTRCVFSVRELCFSRSNKPTAFCSSPSGGQEEFRGARGGLGPEGQRVWGREEFGMGQIDSLYKEREQNNWIFFVMEAEEGEGPRCCIAALCSVRFAPFVLYRGLGGLLMRRGGLY